ncbi:Crp/Fnr family transcriptional regulator [Methylosinus trichosporium]|uniref:Crp/Fnr family transcriptional regulator n=1 Tax=Methylosinus trichosporium (strain ATCC 35070 / NCIMB 11131 / UNIQEM 75 / OB3b) TaxID=595536 RepID=A0A2D2CX56_METT3|nr:Crp/Fnr family transcriptional regulator [Methylosinus trichosporium OB3b]OBS52075.1 cyclic nucleotide-binding protein [Methylosinus sp. 3S-1]
MNSLQRIPFFEGLDAEEAERVARKCVFRRYDERELVVDYDDPSNDVYFIVSGELRVLIRTPAGKEVILTDLRPGQIFGEMAAVDGAVRSANVSALTRAELCIMSAAVFKNVVFSQPAVCERLLRLLTKRVRDLNARLFERSVLDLKHRLYAELLRLAAPRKGFDGQSIISPPPLQHDLAARIGCRREQVNREVQAMVQEGLAEKVRGGLVLLRPALLEQRVSESLEQAG